MKKIFFTMLLSFLAIGTYAQNNFSKLIEKYKGQNEVTFVNINNSMIQFGSNFIVGEDEEAQIAKKMANQVNGISIINTKNKVQGEQLSQDVQKLIDSKKFEELMTVNSEGDDVKFYGLLKGENIKELFLMVNEGDEFTLIGMTGNINPKDVSKIIEKSKINK